MTMTVKDLIKADLPPTHADAVMRKKHTLGSITHNSNHIKDHAKGLEDSLNKLYTVDSKAFNVQLNKEIASIGKIYKHFISMRKTGATDGHSSKHKGFLA
jgi:hypothetical protein